MELRFYDGRRWGDRCVSRDLNPWADVSRPRRQDDAGMTSTMNPPFPGTVLDGAAVFGNDAFVVAARAAKDQGETVRVTIPDLTRSGSHLTGTSEALCRVFVETRIREALVRAGYRRIERCESSPGEVHLIGIP